MAETNIAEPKDLLSGFGVTFTTDLDVQSLVNTDGTWPVTWIGRHRAMAHLHELDLLELCQLFGVSGDFALSRRGRSFVGAVCRGCGETGEVFGEQSVSSFILGWCDRLWYGTCML
jgi:hypothetical protein